VASIVPSPHIVHADVSRVQSARHDTDPPSKPSVKHEAPPRSVPSHASDPSRVPSPHIPPPDDPSLGSVSDAEAEIGVVVDDVDSVSSPVLVEIPVVPSVSPSAPASVQADEASAAIATALMLSTRRTTSASYRAGDVWARAPKTAQQSSSAPLLQSVIPSQ